MADEKRMTIRLDLIRCKRNDLVTVLQKNRDKHRSIFEKGLEGYRKAVLKILEEQIADAEKGKEIDGYVRLTRPKDYTREYDRAIRMLEMSVDDEFDLTDAEFTRFVMDEWDWSRQFTETTSSYSR